MNTEQKALELALTSPWRCYDRRKGLSKEKWIFHKRSGYCFLNIFSLSDYIQNPQQPTHQEKKCLQLLGMTELAYLFWFEYDGWLVKAKHCGVSGHFWNEDKYFQHKKMREGSPW